MADVRAGAVAVVGGRLHQQRRRRPGRSPRRGRPRAPRRRTPSPVPLAMARSMLSLGIEASLAFWTASPSAGLLSGSPPPVLGGHRDGARELREELAAACVDDRLLVLDPRPLGMTGHGFDASGDGSRAANVGSARCRSSDRRARPRRLARRLVLGRGGSRLGGDGLAVVAVDLPSVVSGGDLYDDARAVREVLDDTPGDKVVVGHSYGGIVVTEARRRGRGRAPPRLPRRPSCSTRASRWPTSPATHAARLAGRRRPTARR